MPRGSEMPANADQGYARHERMNGAGHGEEMALDGQRVAPHQAQLRDARAGSWSQTHHGWQFHRGYWR